jgi:hypothetical protein
VRVACKLLPVGSHSLRTGEECANPVELALPRPPRAPARLRATQVLPWTRTRNLAGALTAKPARWLGY